MGRAISTYLYQHTMLGVSLLDQLRRAGFDKIEIYCTRHHFDYTNPSHVREITGWFSDSPVMLHSLHAPLYRGMEGDSPHSVISIAFLEKQRRQNAMDEIKRVLEVAERAPFRFLIVHIGMPGEEFDLHKFDAALTSLEHLRLFARQRGVEILIENILNDLSTPRRLVEFFGHSHLRDLKVCFDSGHAHLDGGVDEAVTLLDGVIASTHLHDNSGARDEHLLPGAGTVAWEKLIAALRRQANDMSLLLEVRGSEANPVSLEKAAAAADLLDRISEGTSE
ncbi:MAG: sugar phosphate isomerase/epimerase [Acidobacteria bacterium]|nr:sugar phosphate isomerase/epimerase [Acidobacteriota bacterium]